MTIEKDAEDIIEKFSKILEDIPDSDETWYITDNLNLTRDDESHLKNPEKILRNANINKMEISLLKKQIGQVKSD